MATDFRKNLLSNHYSTCWRFEMDSIIAISIEIGSMAKIFSTYCANLTIIVYLPPGVRKWIGISQFWLVQVNRQSFLYIVWKCGEIEISDTRVLDLRICTVGIENATILKFAKWPLFNMLAFPNRFDYHIFLFKSIQWQYFLYILCKFDQDWPNNLRDYEGKNYTFLDKTAKIGISYQISQHVRDWSQPQF